MKCFEAESRINDLLDRRDSLKSDIFLQIHLGECEDCSETAQLFDLIPDSFSNGLDSADSKIDIIPHASTPENNKRESIRTVSSNQPWFQFSAIAACLVLAFVFMINGSPKIDSGNSMTSRIIETRENAQPNPREIEASPQSLPTNQPGIVEVARSTASDQANQLNVVEAVYTQYSQLVSNRRLHSVEIHSVIGSSLDFAKVEIDPSLGLTSVFSGFDSAVEELNESLPPAPKKEDNPEKATNAFQQLCDNWNMLVPAP